jgi:hypothetical protein
MPYNPITGAAQQSEGIIEEPNVLRDMVNRV